MQDFTFSYWFCFILIFLFCGAIGRAFKELVSQKKWQRRMVIIAFGEFLLLAVLFANSAEALLELVKPNGASEDDLLSLTLSIFAVFGMLGGYNSKSKAEILVHELSDEAYDKLYNRIHDLEKRLGELERNHKSNK